MITLILTKEVKDQGKAGDIITVSDGHARNYLLRAGSAVVATPTQVALQKEKIARREAETAARHARGERLVRLLGGKAITVKVKHDHGTLFAAVDAEQIAGALKMLSGEIIDPSVITTSAPIKTVGDHEATLDFGPGMSARIRVSVQGA